MLFLILPTLFSTSLPKFFKNNFLSYFLYAGILVEFLNDAPFLKG